MEGQVEFGCFHDNEEAFRHAIHVLQTAVDDASFQGAVNDLAKLRDSIRSRGEQKSQWILLPRIEAILENPKNHARASNKRKSRFFRYDRPTLTKLFFNSMRLLRPVTHSLERLSNPFLRQWSFLCLDFLLVLSVLAFNVVIEAFLTRFHVEIRSYVAPIVRTTDVCLVTIFCMESIGLLALTALGEILRKSRLLHSEARDASNSRAATSMDDNPVLNTFQQANSHHIASLQEETKSGRFTRDAVEMPGAFAVLAQSYSRFDAVSRDELPYWLKDLTDPMAKEYFKAGADLVPKGKFVTRIFLLSRNQIQQREILNQVLRKHMLKGIGVAVVSFEQLPGGLQRRAKELDFAVLDLGSAYFSFRQQEDGYARKMRIVFSKNGANSDVATKVDLYKELLAHAWLVDQTYIDSQQGLIRELLPRLKANNNYLLRLIGGNFRPEGDFFITVTTETELCQKIDNLLTLLEITRAAEEDQPTTQDAQADEHGAHDQKSDILGARTDRTDEAV